MWRFSQEMLGSGHVTDPCHAGWRHQEKDRPRRVSHFLHRLLQNPVNWPFCLICVCLIGARVLIGLFFPVSDMGFMQECVLGPLPTGSIPSYPLLFGPQILHGCERASAPGEFIHPARSCHSSYCLQSFSSILALPETPWFPVGRVFPRGLTSCILAWTTL